MAHDFSVANDRARKRDLLTGVTAPARARALRFLDANEADGQWPYVASISGCGHVEIVGDGGSCVITPAGELRYDAYVRHGRLIERPGLTA